MMPETFLNILSAIGNAVLNSFWQMGLLWLLTVGIARFNKNISVRMLSLLGFFALATGFIIFAGTFIWSLYKPSHTVSILAWLKPDGITNIIFYSIAGAYIIALIIPLIKLFTGYQVVHRLKYKGLHRAPGRYKIFTLNMAGYLGIKRKVTLWLSDLAESPMTVGFLKPVILLPVAAINHLSAEQVEAIILHELAHIKARDYLFNLVSRIILTFLYFNPFAKALQNIYESEREKRADKTVLQFEYDGHMYASTLLQIARTNAFRQKLTLQLSQKPQLLYRVQYMMGATQHRPATPLKHIATSISIMLVAVLMLLLPASYKQSIPEFNRILVQNAFTPAAVSFTTPAEKDYSIYIPVTEKDTFLPDSEPVNPKQLEIIDSNDALVRSETEDEHYYIFTAEAPAVNSLTAEQEQNVQQSITAAKKVFAEASWQQIEKDLAETITTAEKYKLKAALLTKINAADWSKQADILRSSYDRIDWNKANRNRNAVIMQIQLDSIHEHYTSALEHYEASKKQHSIIIDDTLKMKISQAEKIIQITDSIRKKRIIEL